MSIRNWWVQARVALDEIKDVTVRALHGDDSAAADLRLEQLESRVLLSASPMPIDPSVVNGASVDQADPTPQSDGLIADHATSPVVSTESDANHATIAPADDVRTQEQSARLLDTLTNELLPAAINETPTHLELVFVDRSVENYEQLVNDL